MFDRVHRELTEEDISKISGTYHAWRGDKSSDEYKDIPGFCKSATIDEIRKNNYILTPGRYVGMEEIEDDGEPFEEKMERLTTELAKLFKESRDLEEEIRKNLEGIGYGM